MLSLRSIAIVTLISLEFLHVHKSCQLQRVEGGSTVEDIAILV
jgi:hypothetical protein